MSNETVKYQQVQLIVSNAQPSQTILVDMKTANGTVAWSTGPNFDGSGGIDVEMTAGQSLPLTRFLVTSNEVNVGTSSAGGGGGQIGFVVTLYVAYKPTVDSISLKSSSDSGITVQVKIGFAQPQTVNSTYSSFPLSNS